MLAAFDTSDVFDVTEGSQGLLEGGALRAIVDVHPVTRTAYRRSRADSRHAASPSSKPRSRGSSQQIGAGPATMLVDAENAAIEAHADLLGAITTQRIHVGGGMSARA